MRKPSKDDLETIAWLAQIRWPKGIICPSCQSRDVSDLIESRGVWQCRPCRKQFGVFLGTMFEGTRLSPFTIGDAIVFFHTDSLRFGPRLKFTTVRALQKWTEIGSYSAAHKLHLKISKKMDKKLDLNRFIFKLLDSNSTI